MSYGADAVLVLDPAWPSRQLGPPRYLGGGAYFFQADGSAAGVWLLLRQAN